MKTQLLVLKSKLCGLEHTSRKFRKRIAASRGEKRWTLRFRKLALGAHTREHLIAYGLIRGIPYSKIENKCAKGNEPNLPSILEIVQAHVPYHERAKWNADAVARLLSRDA